MFEYDPAKSESNRAKHGIDFDEAQALWLGELLDLGRLSYGGEDRQLLVGSLDGRCWTAVITQRGGNIRIISVRRSRPSEEMAFHGR